MRLLLLAILVAGCSDSSDIDAPDDCEAGELHVVHRDVDERFMIGNYAFVNRLNETSPGSLDIGSAPMTVHVEFETLASNGQTVDARGSVTVNGLDVGNCDGLPSRLFVDDGSWRFELRDLANAPYCTGTALSASLGGCYRAR